MKFKEGLRIDFTEDSGKNLNYMRFEHCDFDERNGTYIGSIDSNEVVKLKELRSEINRLLRIK